MSDAVIAAGIGNMFLSDDGFGVEVARRLAQRRALPSCLRVLDSGIRGVHLAYELLDGCRGLVLVDAVQRGAEPGTLTVIAADDPWLSGRAAVDGHDLDPASVLGLVERLGGRPPRTFVVGCEPAVLESGIGLSPPVESAVEPAVETVLALVEEL